MRSRNCQTTSGLTSTCPLTNDLGVATGQNFETLIVSDILDPYDVGLSPIPYAGRKFLLTTDRVSGAYFNINLKIADFNPLTLARDIRKHFRIYRNSFSQPVHLITVFSSFSEE